MQADKKIYFISDFHLGVPTYEKSREREKLICKWLDEIKNDAAEIYLVGDLFDFWFEYKYVVPKGYIRLLGKIAELSDSGIIINIFTGNHDMWMYDYLPQELGVNLFYSPVTKIYHGKSFYIGHGDGLGPGDKGYKFIKKIFRNKFCQWLFARLHPNFGIALANYFSRTSRNKTKHENIYLGDDKEFLVQFCKDELKKQHYDYFIFGHRHLPIEKQIQNSIYINLGDWLEYYTYAVFDGNKLELKKYNAV
jgi:UDP-2,3-diacylglucosamine hydrolase